MPWCGQRELQGRREQMRITVKPNPGHPIKAETTRGGKGTMSFCSQELSSQSDIAILSFNT